MRTSSIIRKLVYLTISNFDMGSKKQNDVVILCYHSISNDNWRFSESFDTLKKQIEYMLTIRKPISLEDLEKHLNGTKKITVPSFIISFDDGYENVLQTVEYFQKKQIKPAIFILSNPEKADRKELGNNLTFLSYATIRTLKKAGWTIGVHSATHADFNTIDAEAQRYEIEESKKTLEKELGFALSYFSYPKGIYSDSIISTVKKSGYTMAVSMDDGFITKDTNKYIIPRIGVDATHSFDEFTVLFSPSVIRLRGLLKQTPIANFFKS